MKPGCALVTGASRGLGAAMARCLAADGWPVAINDLNNAAAADEVAAAITAAGGTAMTFTFDVTDQGAIRQGVREIRDTLGPVSVLVNNATGPQPLIPIAEQTWQHHLDQLTFFVKAPLELLQEVLPDMRSTGYGRVINIGSEVTDLGTPEFAHYVGAKSAMHGLTRSWACELGPEGILVNTVEPGWIPVERHQEATTEELRGYTAGVPLGHQGVPSDVGALVAFLASPAARFITGQRYAVNGGRTLT